MIGKRQSDVRVRDEEKKGGKVNCVDDEQLERVVGGMRVQNTSDDAVGGGAGRKGEK